VTSKPFKVRYILWGNVNLGPGHLSLRYSSGGTVPFSSKEDKVRGIPQKALGENLFLFFQLVASHGLWQHDSRISLHHYMALFISKKSV
jgi:hypothetical protein